jgi:ATP-dependent helicase HrpA
VLAGLPAFNSCDELPDLYQWLAQLIAARVGEPVAPAQIASLALPDHLRMNIRVLDAEDGVLAEGRDLLAIKRKLRAAPAPARGARTSTTANATEHRQWDFGDLPESVEVERNRLRFRVYPGVEDRGSAVARIEARSAAEAEAISRSGLTRLAILALPQQAKYVSQRIADDRQLVLLSSGLTLAQPLSQALTWRAARECFLPDGTPLPRTQEAFAKLLETRRTELSEVADRLGRSVLETLTEWRAVRAGLDRVRSPVFAAAVADIDAQLATLLPPDFVESTPQPWLDRLPRYLKALRRRIERLPGNVERDAELAARVAPFAKAARALMTQSTGSRSRPELDQLRWTIEEFRISLHAQEIRTLMRASEKRLAEQVQRAQNEARG